MEIEKKFKIKYLPDGYDSSLAYVMEQGYLCSNPTVRIRKQSFYNKNNEYVDEYILTYKSKFGKASEIDKSLCASNEVEVPLTKEAYFHLRDKIDGNVVKKTRYHIKLDSGLVAELDIFDDILSGIVFVEVEFDSEKEALDFVPPDWFGDDLSMDFRYKNLYLSTINDKNKVNELI